MRMRIPLSFIGIFGVPRGMNHGFELSERSHYTHLTRKGTVQAGRAIRIQRFPEGLLLVAQETQCSGRLETELDIVCSRHCMTSWKNN